MKRVYFTLLLVFLSMNLLCQVEWIKHSENPVMVPGSGGWDQIYIAPGSVIYIDNNYHMWYWGGNPVDADFRIGHAISPDGITWTKDTDNNPVLHPGQSGDWDENFVLDPAVIYSDSIFHMWYTGHKGDDLSKDSRIGHATSSDGVLWTKDPNNPVLDLGPDGSWDDTWVAFPSVLYDGEEYHMWYTGHQYSSTIEVGHATSPDGIIWTKDSLNPVITRGAGWDYHRKDFTDVIFDGFTFYMWYSGSQEGTSGYWEIGYATSDDGSTWIKNDQNPIFRTGREGSWDSQHVGISSVIYSSGLYNMWYSGGNSPLTGSIGYAKSWPATIDNNIADQIRIYPNPTKTLLTIESGLSDQYDINITTINGQAIYHVEMDKTTHQIDLSSFQNGIYLITIRSKDLVTTRKIVKF